MKNFIVVLVCSMFGISAFAQNEIENVPIQLLDGVIFFELSVNNSRPLNFMFDTGANITVIGSQVAEDLQLSTSSELKIGTSGKSLTSKISEHNKVRIGKNFSLDSLSLAIMDLSHLSKYFRTNVDGIIGTDLLQKAVVETYIDAMQIVLYANKDFNYNGHAKALKILGLEYGHFGLPLEVVPKGSNKSISLMIKIDTGAANYLTFNNHTVETYELINPKKKYKKKMGFGAESTITANLRGKLSSAEFGGKTWKNVPVVFEVDPLNIKPENHSDGLIGQAMLLDFNITYHLQEERIYLEKRN